MVRLLPWGRSPLTCQVGYMLHSPVVCMNSNSICHYHGIICFNSADVSRADVC